MEQTWRIAGVQFAPVIEQSAANLDRMLDFVDQARRLECKLVIFPECALSGYCFDSRAEAVPYAEPIPGPSTEKMAEVCAAHNLFVVMGMLESESERLFNACALVGPGGVIGSYRKVHLPFLGIDRFADPGDRPFRLHEIDGLRLGIHICYDGSFPESARVMALQGADLIALPTNWPPGAECASEHMVATRAMENHVYYAAVNRVGEERGVSFIGGSRICAPNGQSLAADPSRNESLLTAEMTPAVARNKQLIRVEGVHEINRIADRRPDFYEIIAEKKMR